LREAGVDTIHVSEVGLASASDVDVIAWCRANDALVVTLDADFHAHIALSGAAAPSAIRLRIQAQKGPEVGRLILDIVRARREDLEAGALVTVRTDRLRVRRLPVARSTR